MLPPYCDGDESLIFKNFLHLFCVFLHIKIILFWSKRRFCQCHKPSANEVPLIHIYSWSHYYTFSCDGNYQLEINSLLERVKEVCFHYYFVLDKFTTTWWAVLFWSQLLRILKYLPRYHIIVLYSHLSQFYSHYIIESILILCTSCVVLILHRSHFNPFFYDNCSFTAC